MGASSKDPAERFFEKRRGRTGDAIQHYMHNIAIRHRTLEGGQQETLTESLTTVRAYAFIPATEIRRIGGSYVEAAHVALCSATATDGSFNVHWINVPQKGLLLSFPRTSWGL